MTRDTAPTITQLPQDGADIKTAQRIAARLGYTQTAYTSTSALWGLYCLASYPGQPTGCVVLTKELGWIFVRNLDELGIA